MSDDAMCSPKWKLMVDGDGFEQKYWPILEPIFPNYEIFWSEFVVPMTCRTILSKDHLLYIHPKIGVDADLQNISMAHYTIFRRFLLVHELLNIVPNIAPPLVYEERLSLVYSSLGTIIDMVSNITFFIARLQHRLGLRGDLLKKKSQEQIKQIAGKFFDREYDGRLRDLEKSKRPVCIDLHRFGDFVEDVIGKTPLTKLFGLFSQRIRTIRNAVVHNPIMGSAGNNTLVPKIDKLKKYYLWEKLFYDLDLNDFENKEDMMRNDYGTLAKILNDLWGELIPRFSEVSRIKDFDKLNGSLENKCSECGADMQLIQKIDNCFALSYDKEEKSVLWSSCSANKFASVYLDCLSCGYKIILGGKEL